MSSAESERGKQIPVIPRRPVRPANQAGPAGQFVDQNIALPGNHSEELRFVPGNKATLEAVRTVQTVLCSGQALTRSKKQGREHRSDEQAEEQGWEDASKYEPSGELASLREIVAIHLPIPNDEQEGAADQQGRNGAPNECGSPVAADSYG